MVDLIDHIDELIHECLGLGQYQGLCRLIEDDSGIYPVTYPDEHGKQLKVTPDDRYPLLIYHRLLDGSFEDSEEFSFGRSMARQNRQAVRMVVVVDFRDGHDYSGQILNALPVSIENVDYKSVTIDSAVTLIRDRKAIWSTEWGEAYADKYQMRYEIFAVEYSINHITCEDCVTSNG